MIRILICFAVMFPFAAPAAEWARYVNPRFGAAVDIPTDYRVAETPSVAGDGKLFRASNGRSSILLWGGPAASEFIAHARGLIATDEADGWSITYRSETPDWAAWSGTRSGHVFYAKSVATCDGRQTATVRLTYPAMDVPRFDPISNRLGQSLGQDGGCF
jgi:hypothetical protein